ncbi:MAG: ABC transporter substrate-binding protein [Dehalococcoidia bacterium]|nr:ABC transporter substrate-binding protein [Dehalococcoidia bacterium]
MSDDRADQIWERPLTRRQLVSAVAAGGASLALVGCGDDDGSPASTGTQAAGQPKRGGSLNLLANSSLDVIDPHKSVGLNDPWSFVANTPLKLDWMKGTLNPGLVEKWESPDPLTMVLRLKQGVHFQKESAAAGRELEASDIVANLERIRTKGDATFLAAYGFANVDTYEPTDRYTVRVKFKKPDANFLSWCSTTATTILPKEALAKYSANLANVAAWYGTGPFIPDLGAYHPGVSSTFRRNPNYDLTPGGLPYLDAVTLITINDFSARAAAVRGGQLDISIVPTLDTKDIAARGFQMQSTENKIIAAQHEAMNPALPPMNDVRVRRAVNLAIDREALMGVVAEGYGCTSIILGCNTNWFLTEKEWEGKPGFRKDKKQDIAEAKQLLAAAGIDPQKTTLKLATSAQSAYKTGYDTAIAFKGMLEGALGFKIDLTIGAITALAMKPNPHHMVSVTGGYGSGMLVDAPPWNTMYSTGGGNGGLWTDKKTDDLIEQQASELDTNKRKDLLQQLQRYLMQDDVMGFAPTIRNFDWTAARKDIRGWAASAYFLSHYAWQFDKVWIDS